MKKTTIALALVVSILAALGLSACSLGGGSSVATVNGEKIPKSLFQFYMDQVKAQMQQQQSAEITDDFWENTEIEGKKAIDYVREKALDEAVNYMLIEQKAKELNLTLSQDDITAIGKQKNYMVQQFGGKDAYKAALEEQGLTEDSYQKLLENSVYANKLTEQLTPEVDDAAAKNFFDEHIVRVKHILIKTVDDNMNPLSKEEQDAARTKAEEILSRAKAGEDFDQLVETESQDPGSASQPEGYYLGEGFILGAQGAMVTEFEKASLELGVEEISGLVETNYGYHIIKRYENQQETFDSNKDEILSRAKADKFTDLQQEWKDSAAIEVNEEVYSQMK